MRFHVLSSVARHVGEIADTWVCKKQEI